MVTKIIIKLRQQQSFTKSISYQNKNKISQGLIPHWAIVHARHNIVTGVLNF